MHIHTLLRNLRNSASTEFLLEIKIDSKRIYLPQLLAKERFVHRNSGGHGQSAHAAIALSITMNCSNIPGDGKNLSLHSTNINNPPFLPLP